VSAASSAPTPSDPVLTLSTGGRIATFRLPEALSPDAAEEAERKGNEWIKSLRHAEVAGRPFRDAFVYRGDSLWWFAELYLHKQRTAARAYGALFALEALFARERPDGAALLAGDDVVRALAPLVARRRHVAYTAQRPPRPAWRRRAAAPLTAWIYAAAPRIGRWRTRRGRGSAPSGTHAVVAFVHSAFWREQSSDDAYVGPVLNALQARLGPGAMALVGVGPATRFQARDWRRRIGDFRAGAAAPAGIVPVEAFSPASALAGADAIWRDRARIRRALVDSRELRRAAVVDGYDAWDLIERDLIGIADLQFPWSARAMDEAAAALDALRPRAVVTYAEAGGWGRAVTLEARRRGIPSVGLQHGFISRHWLNYRHEPDEIEPSPGNPADRGCPLPDLTLLYDGMAERHLLQAGRYPASRLRVTGNPRLDDLMRAARALSAGDIARAREQAGARPDQHLVLLAAKRIPEFDATFAALMQAVAAMPDVQLAVRPHPAETDEPYRRLAGSIPNVRVVPPSLPVVALIAAARLVATINSTVAIEAMALDVPALAMRLPNYLSPFVEAGAMAGTATLGAIAPTLARLVRDEEARAALAAARRRFLAEHAIESDGRAADRAAEAILTLAGVRS
jgi:hypothetical protein